MEASVLCFASFVFKCQMPARQERIGRTGSIHSACLPEKHGDLHHCSASPMLPYLFPQQTPGCATNNPKLKVPSSSPPLLVISELTR